jgi:hypothetical protein
MLNPWLSILPVYSICVRGLLKVVVQLLMSRIKKAVITLRYIFTYFT